MNCPGPGVAPGQAGGIADGCNGHGKCMTLQELGNFSTNANGSALNGPTYADWDASKIKGCICDKYFYRGPYVFNWVDYAGHDCSHFACPYGDDPKTYNQLFNVQTVTCDASAGSFTLSFRGNSTQPVHVWFAPMGFENSLQAALEGINTIRNVTVSIDATGSICNPAMPVTSTITFVTEHGDIPLLEVDDSALTGAVVVERTVSSTKENVECNRRGKCGELGVCVCVCVVVCKGGFCAHSHTHTHARTPSPVLSCRSFDGVVPVRAAVRVVRRPGREWNAGGLRLLARVVAVPVPDSRASHRRHDAVRLTFLASLHTHPTNTIPCTNRNV